MPKTQQIADDVWILRGGLPTPIFNVYFVRDGDGVLMFDSGIKAMLKAVRAEGEKLGGITRVVLGHSHADHRGTAAALGVPVLCHPEEKADAEGDGGLHYIDLKKAQPQSRLLLPMLMKSWDGGPVTVAGTLNEGDAVASGFEVVHLPGKAPGMIGLWRAADRVAVVGDCFYTINPQTGLKSKRPRRSPDAFNLDSDQARASMRKLAELEPATVWTGHGDPLRGDVRGRIERAASAA
jgi:hydroxyacylglutathione hydrolase